MFMEDDATEDMGGAPAMPADDTTEGEEKKDEEAAM